MVDELKKCSGYLGDCEHPDSNDGLLPMNSKYFYRNSGLSDGLKNYCKVCSKKQNDILNKKRKEKFRNKYRLKSNNCVYAFKDGGDIVYIGSSDNTGFRINNHVNNKTETGNSCLKELNTLQRKMLSWTILWWGEEGDSDTRVHQEKMLIQLHQPKFNKILYKSYNG